MPKTNSAPPITPPTSGATNGSQKYSSGLLAEYVVAHELFGGEVGDGADGEVRRCAATTPFLV